MKTFTKKDFIQEIIDQLMDVADGFEVPMDEDGYCGGGVCWVVAMILDELLEDDYHTCEGVNSYIGALIANWPHHCGSRTFPIGGVKEYFRNEDHYGLWTGDREVDRRDLCEGMADGLKELL